MGRSGIFNSTMKKAIITGITGQDGSYLAELLLKKGYQVHGIIRRASSFNTQRIDHIYKDPHLPNNNMQLHYGDMSDASNISRLIEKVQPDEIYNLAAQSHVKVSFEVPEYTAQTDAIGTLRLLDAIKDMQLPVRFYQASTLKCTGKYKLSHSLNQHHFIQDLLMVQQKYMPIGLQ